ncbi:MAG: hypothetical protein K8F91_23480 [Candidatus Obscuribacterales bacterium]|nr:hypothetical protein [Candidatus Obscuribacterales bacterium]
MTSFKHIKYLLAGNPHTTPKIFTRLALSKWVKVRRRVAENYGCPVEVLKSLSTDKSTEVRIAVASNPNLNKLIVEKLSLDKNPDVRFWIASNANLPIDILKTLSQDQNPFVSSRARKTLSRLRTENEPRFSPEISIDNKPNRKPA